MSVDYLRLFREGRLSQDVPEHKVQIEARLAALKVEDENEYKRMKDLYGSKDIPETVTVEVEVEEEEPKEEEVQEPKRKRGRPKKSPEPEVVEEVENTPEEEATQE